jgi:hypothetical protein
MPLTQGVIVVKTFFVTDERVKLARVFVPNKPCLVLANKARAYSSGAPWRSFLGLTYEKISSVRTL